MKIFSQALDTILPPRCPVSGEIVTHHGALAPHIWRELDFIAQPFCSKCGVPFDYDLAENLTCADCLAAPPQYNMARSALRYNDASRDLILGFKHADKIFMVKSFVPWLRSAGADILPQTEIFVPVPLHFTRLIKRRYNQAAIIAGELSVDTGIPCLYEALERKRMTRTQGHLSAEDREKNVKNAFALNPKYKEAVKGKVITLIDDVYTTGATVSECCKTLLENGASKVHILTIARVGRSDPLQ